MSSRLNTGTQVLNRIFTRMDEGALSQEEAWELANKVYDKNLIELHEQVANLSSNWHYINRGIKPEDFLDYYSEEDWNPDFEKD